MSETLTQTHFNKLGGTNYWLHVENENQQAESIWRNVALSNPNTQALDKAVLIIQEQGGVGTGRNSGFSAVGIKNNKKPNSTAQTPKNKPVEKDLSLLGANGSQFPSTTVWREKGSKARIDVENPAPGVRAGQIHYQDANNKKYYYNPKDDKFYVGKIDDGVLAPKSIQNLLNDKKFRKGIDKALKYLGAK
ncbi:filamentous hemagglutinin [Moraxella cuniculi DSM 21768]|uniref:Filamentous hemagglutinin n=1 Tax=Moraxella cuniculi DSM 21768 TaxID=1122245 RepID=A0A1N7GC97_9GAMM|nr:hypothetical protein [Moraxella cuniculi]OOS03860.1 hypothetical protein B0189_08915 [Moraxella cuniculi]SIS10207.1 filamentous hemagglutinin [Moraxella cuniculi DSM 21768]